jgi:hypothetical protein
MKYILMMNGPKSGWDEFMKWPHEALVRHIEFMKSFSKKLKDQGELLSADGLTPPAEAKLVRAKRDGGPPTIDGAFAETKEFLAGWWIVEVPNEARALEIAAEASAAPDPENRPMGIPIEVRRIADGPPEL